MTKNKKAVTTDTIMAGIFREAKKAVRRDYKEEIALLRLELKDMRKENRRFTEMERELTTTRDKLKKERGEVRTIASKIIREYDKLLQLKDKKIGSMINNSCRSLSWSTLNKERTAIVALRKQAKER